MKNIFYFLFLSIVTTFIFLKVYGHPLSPTTVNKKTTICVIPLNGGVSKTQLDSSINYLQNTFPNTIITVGENIKLPKNWSINHLRDQSQRNYISNALKKFEDDDWIIISDLDEIPNPASLEKFNPKFPVPPKITTFLFFIEKISL